MGEGYHAVFQNYLLDRVAGKQITLQESLSVLSYEDRIKLNEKFAALKVIEKLIQDLPKIESSPRDSLIKESEPIKQATFAGCKLIRKLGQGGMGVVYLAYQEKLRREVVIKVLRPFAAESEALKQRFIRESHIIGHLSHENIVPVYDVGEEEETYYIIMKYVEGIPLSHIIEKISGVDRGIIQLQDIMAILKPKDNGQVSHKNPTEFFCNLMIKVCDAVQYAHDQGVVHRDIKPSNIIVMPNGNPVLVDFGLGQDVIEKSLTLSGEFLGTPIYSAPELFEKGKPQKAHLLDVYSLGVTLYELLTGGVPYEGESIYEIFSNVKSEEPLRPQTWWKGIPQDLETIISKSISKDTTYRYQTVRGLRDDLQSFLNYRPITAKAPSTIKRIVYFVKRKRTKVAVTAALLALIGFSAVAIWRSYQLNMNLKKSTSDIEIFQTQEGLNAVIEALVHKQYDKALHEIDKLHSKYPENINYHVWYLGLKMKQDNDVSYALSELNKLEQKDPGNFWVMLAKMISLHETNIEESNKIKKQIITAVADHPLLKEIPKYLFFFGVEDSLVTEFIELALKKFPKDAELHFLKSAYCQQYLNDDACTQKHKEEAARLNPSRFLDGLGDYYANKDASRKTIIEWIDTLNRLNRNSISSQKASSWYSLARLQLRIGNCEEANSNIKRALNIEPLDKTLKAFQDKLASECK